VSSAPTDDDRPHGRATTFLVKCLFTLGVGEILLGLLVAWTYNQFFDFSVFYDAVVAWSRGESPYRVPNLNTPYVTFLLMPLAWFSRRTAWLIWQATSAAACLLTIRLCRQDRRWPGPVAWAVFVAHASTSAQVLMGQVVWVLGVPLALAWRAAMAGRLESAGVWVGICIAAKPFLAPVLAPAIIDRRWRRMSAIALLTAIAIVGIWVVFAGTALFGEWLDRGNSAWGSVPQPLNASPASLASAVGTPPIIGVLAGGLGMVVTLVQWRRLSPEQQWLATLLSALMVTPLCWIQYTALLLPLTWLTWRGLRTDLAVVAIALTTVPPVVVAHFDPWHVIYVLGMVCWLAAVLVRPSHRVIVMPVHAR
jgi:hypothetical protein